MKTNFKVINCIKLSEYVNTYNYGTEFGYRLEK